MMKSLSLLAVLVVSAIYLPQQAHATCSTTLLYSYSKSWVPGQFSPALSPQNHITCPGTVATHCGAPNQNQECQQCSQSGTSGWWDWDESYFCDLGSPMNLHGYVEYRPNTLYHYNYKCTCSENVYSCAWQ